MDTKRLAALDGLRGIAALAVACFHYFYHYGEIYQRKLPSADWAQLGYYGVHLFFMVSGFVIFWSLSRYPQASRFIWSRFSRLFPTYWAAVTITFIATLILGPGDRHVSSLELLTNYTMLQGFLGVAHVDGVYWTLTLELSFYFWMLTLLQFQQLSRIELWLLGWIAVSIALQLSGLAEKIPMRVKFVFLWDYISFFALGISIFRIKAGTNNKLTPWVIALGLVSAFCAYPLAVALFVCGLVGIFYLAVSGRLGFLASAPLTFLGSISYAFYLVHQNIGYAFIYRSYALGLSPYWGIALAFLVATCLASALTYLIEKPAIKYLRASQLPLTLSHWLTRKWNLLTSR